MSDNKNKLINNSIFQICFKHQEWLGFGDGGTIFVIHYKGEWFLITALHCLEYKDMDIKKVIEDLFIINLTHEYPVNIPLNELITLKDNIYDEFHDIAILHVDKQTIFRDIKKIANINIQEEIKFLNSKEAQEYISKNQTLLKKDKTAFLKNIPGYKDQAYYKKIIQNTKTSLKDLGHLSYIENPTFIKGQKLFVLGYPSNKQILDNENKKVKKSLIKLKCVYDLENQGLHKCNVLNYQNNLSGFSGSPIFDQGIGKIVGVVVRGGNSIIHFISFEIILKGIKLIYKDKK